MTGSRPAQLCALNGLPHDETMTTRFRPTRLRVALTLVAAVAALAALPGEASAETWKRTGTFPPSINTPRQVCQYVRAETLSLAALSGVRVLRFRCQYADGNGKPYPMIGRWTPLDYVRLGGRVVDSRGKCVYVPVHRVPHRLQAARGADVG